MSRGKALMLTAQSCGGRCCDAKSRTWAGTPSVQGGAGCLTFTAEQTQNTIFTFCLFP